MDQIVTATEEEISEAEYIFIYTIAVVVRPRYRVVDVAETAAAR